MKHQTSSVQLCGQPIVLTLTQSTARFGGSCRSVCTGRSQIRDVDQLKSRLIEEWEHFHQVVIDKAVRQGRPHLGACVRLRAHGGHFEHRLQMCWRIAIRTDAHLTVNHACAYSGHLCF